MLENTYPIILCGTNSSFRIIKKSQGSGIVLDCKTVGFFSQNQ